MTSAPLTVSEASGISEAIERMQVPRVRRAPVVNDSGDLVGIVSLDDLLPIVAEELGALSPSGKAPPQSRPPRAGQAPEAALKALES
jgi:CBS domain containing-hemolysin-like protein